jgi:ribonuclease HI
MLGKRNDTSCLIRLMKNSWHQVIEKVHSSEERISIRTPLSAYSEVKEILNEETMSSIGGVEVNIVGIEEAIIQRVVKNKEIQKELSDIARMLIEKEEVNIFTDRSLALDHEGRQEEKRMGIGWVIVDNNLRDSSVSFKCRIGDWPSSTQAELGAIWTALLVVPKESNVKIYSDSKVAIEGIQNFKGSTSIRNNFKIKNRTLINQIIDCSESKKINLEFIKVKSHSKDKWNDEADKIAKEGLWSNNMLEVQDVTLGKIRIVPMWKSKSVERPLRSFINLTTATIYEST